MLTSGSAGMSDRLCAVSVATSANCRRRVASRRLGLEQLPYVRRYTLLDLQRTRTTQSQAYYVTNVLNLPHS